VLAIVSYRMGLGLQVITAGEVDLAYVVWGHRLRAVLDRTKRHTPLSTDPALRANWSDAAQDVARELAACDASRGSCNGGQQFGRVEHVHVNDGGQAVIGNVNRQRSLA
jgi:hypothetical protein